MSEDFQDCFAKGLFKSYPLHQDIRLFKTIFKTILILSSAPFRVLVSQYQFHARYFSHINHFTQKDSISHKSLQEEDRRQKEANAECKLDDIMLKTILVEKYFWNSEVRTSKILIIHKSNKNIKIIVKISFSKLRKLTKVLKQ